MPEILRVFVRKKNDGFGLHAFFFLDAKEDSNFYMRVDKCSRACLVFIYLTFPVSWQRQGAECGFEINACIMQPLV